MTVAAAQPLLAEIDTAKPRPKPTAAAGGTQRGARYGIKAKLFLAFCSLAGLTAVASAVAWYVFGEIDHAVTRVTVESVPGTITALSLAEKSAEIAATAPALMASDSQEERVLQQAKLEQRAHALVALIDDLKASNVAPERTIALSNIEQEITAKLEELSVAVEKRLRLEAQRQAAVAELSRAHASFVKALEPFVDDSVFDLVIRGEDVTAKSGSAITGLVEGGVSKLDQLLTVNAAANLAAGLLAEAAHVGDPVLIEPIRERFVAATATIDRNLRQLPSGSETTALRERAEGLLAFGGGSDNIFDVRKRTLGMAAGDRHFLDADEKQLAALKTAHESLVVTLTPMIDDAAFDGVLTTEKVTADSKKAITELIDVGADVLERLLTVRSEGNLAAGLLDQAAESSDVNLLEPLNERFIAAKEHIEKMLRELPPTLDDGQIQRAASTLTDLGRGNDGIFALRRAELRQIAVAQSALEGSRALAVQLGDEVAGLVTAARAATNAAASQSAQAINSGKVFMMIITVASVVGAVIVMLYYVLPWIIRPLERITGAMTDLAAGDTSVDIPGRERSDELGRMAQALGVFRDTAIEVQKSNLKEIRETRRRLSEAIESISEAFSLYDSEDRLVACNSKYRMLLYPDVGDEAIIGMTFEALIRRAAERGDIVDAEGRLEEWVVERLAHHRDPSAAFLQRRGDGRWVIVSERKTDDGGTVAVYSDVTELKQREEELSVKTNALEQLSRQLAKYLSPQVYESIFTGRSEVKVASRRKKLTIFFSDLEGFTETTERLESEDLTQLLNHYLTEMSKIALLYGGTIDKYVGDAILIFFGDPETQGVKADALACVRMAIAMRERMRELDSVWRASGLEKPPRVRTGINTGFCTVGNFGSEVRMDYTIIGGGVNLACRLEQMAPPGEILISYETYAHVKDQVCCEERGHINVKGISHPVATYQVIDAYDNLGKSRDLIHEDYSTLKLDINLEAMSTKERSHAVTVLRRAVDRLSRANKAAAPAIPEKKDRV
jgi:class 3 adenylate cyclase/phosphoglycerate-specific signal transduction histidine kinase